MTSRGFAGLTWRHAAGYADTANYGIPHVAVLNAVEDALARWEHGASRITDWISSVERARSAFASIVSARPDDVACSAAASHLIGLVAASLSNEAEVLIPEGEFTSNVFPWLAQRDRGVNVRTCALEDLSSSIRGSTTLVAFSLVQSADGAVTSLADVVAAARGSGARVLVDATQACGWMDVDAREADFLVCAAYKWFMAPRGCAFMAVRPDRLDEVRPSSANWFAGEDVASALYGPPLRLARGARRLDLSPAWVNWAGAAAALESIADLDPSSVREHGLGLARALCLEAGLPAPASPIVSIPVAGSPALDRHGLTASLRDGRLRVSFHLHNTQEDVDAVLDALRHVEPAGMIAF